MLGRREDQNKEEWLKKGEEKGVGEMDREWIEERGLKIEGNKP